MFVKLIFVDNVHFFMYCTYFALFLNGRMIWNNSFFYIVQTSQCGHHLSRNFLLSFSTRKSFTYFLAVVELAFWRPLFNFQFLVRHMPSLFPPILLELYYFPFVNTFHWISEILWFLNVTLPSNIASILWVSSVSKFSTFIWYSVILLTGYV